ncbi:MAG: hypothetical protein KDC61_10755 [Saprospiraceae bacterium]|nr:hypothetical protein [Saprospiraceae bacterium]
MKKNIFTALFVCVAVIAQAQYLETFNENNKGYLNNSVNDFTGVNWTLSPWSSGRDAEDYCGTGPYAGSVSPLVPAVPDNVFGSMDVDLDMCWTSPKLVATATGTAQFMMDISWIGYDGNSSPADYINVEYRLNDGAWIRHPNVAGPNGDPSYTVRYTPDGSFDGSATTNFSSISIVTGDTMRVRVCWRTSSNAELTTFDNVSVSNFTLASSCSQPVIGTAIMQAGSCNGTNGAIQVTATGGTPGYNVAWGGTSSGNPAGTEIASSGGMYTITSLNSGPYTITVTDAASCSTTAMVSVSTATAMSLQTTVLGTTCSSVSDGEIDLTVSNGSPPYSYSWSNLPGSPDPQDQTGLATGTYVITVTDNAGCTTNTSIAVGVEPPGAYLETFSLDNKGYLINFGEDFAGVNWTLSSWSPDPFGRDANDFFRTNGGALTALDVDHEVCWISPVIDINPPGSGIGFSVDLAWVGFDDEDYINVKYSLDNGGYTTVLNQVGLGAGTIQYPNLSTDNSGSTTVSVTGLSGNSLQIQVCGDFNADEESMTIDNVSVPGSNGLYCPCPTITFTATPTSTCSGSSNGQIAVTGVTGGTGPYMYSKDNGANYQSGATFTGLAAGMYDVVVKDANGCESAASQVTVGTNSLPVATCPADVTVCSADAAFALTGGSPGGGTYSGMGVSGGMFDPATAGAGPHTITYTYTDGNGCSDDCTFNATVLTSPTLFNVTGGGSYCSGGPGVEVGLSGSDLDAQYDLYRDGNLVGTFFGTGSPLSFGQQTAAGTYLVVGILNIVCQKVMSGTVNVSVQTCNIDFSGKIVWEDDDVSGVKDATVNLTGSASGSDVTDTNGDFLIMSGVTTGNFTLKPEKTANKLNGVTAADIVAIQQHIANVLPISDPYKQVCADVNKSNSITGLDVTIINQSLLGNPAALNQFKTSWRFVPSDYALSVPPWGFPEQRSYTGISGAQTNQDFIGMKTGDVTGDANPANFGAGTPLALHTGDRILQSGESFEAAFSAGQFDDLAAFQLALHFDPAQLQFNDIQPVNGGLPLTADNFGLYNIAGGEIRSVWAQATGFFVSEGSPVFRLHFTALQGGVKLSEVLFMDETELPGYAYSGTLEESAVELVFDAATGTNNPNGVSGLQMQVYPNPFREETMVSFAMPEAGEVQLRIVDVNGRELLRIDKACPAGHNSEALRLENAATAGVLSCELLTPFGVVSKKLVMLR